MPISHASIGAFFRTSTVLGTAAFLAACGGGGSGPAVTSTGADPVLFDGTDFNATDESRSFPYYFIDADSDVIRGVGSIRWIDETTLELTTDEPGAGVRSFTLTLADGDDNNGLYTLGGGVDFRLVDRGDYYLFYLENQPGGFAVSGGFGYETEVMPTGFTGSYDVDDFARILLISDDDPDFESLTGSASLLVNFNTGAVTGSVFSGTNLVELDDIGTEGVDMGDLENDSLFVDIGINGMLSGNKIDGTVSTTSVNVVLNGEGDPVPLTLALTNSDVDGQFFGEFAEWVNGTWGADYTLSDGNESVSGEAVGFFEAQLD